MVCTCFYRFKGLIELACVCNSCLHPVWATLGRLSIGNHDVNNAWDMIGGGGHRDNACDMNSASKQGMSLIESIYQNT